MQAYNRLQTLLALIGAMLMTVIVTGILHAGETSAVPDFRHVRVENPASLTGGESENIYQQIIKDLSGAFESSGVSQIQGYRSWKRYNTVPYMSSTHGNRYINNYANETANGYGRLARGTVMPAGSVLIKDSFAVTQDGEVIPGRLFVMEKLYAGSNPPTGDWRYVMIGADGAVIADTTGATSPQAEFCHVCHKVRASRDFLFYVPPDFRSSE